MPSGLLLPNGQRPGVTPGPVPAEPDPNAPVECLLAFLVYQHPNGSWFASPLDHGDLKPQREVTFDDITAGCANLLHDLVVTYPVGTHEVITAFIVFQLPNGLWQLAPQIDAPLIPSREPVHSDIRGGLTVTMRDVHTREIAEQTAQAVVNAQFQLGQAIAQQRQNAQVQAALAAEQDGQRRRGGR